MIARFCSDRRGATSIEYAVIAAGIFLAIIASIVPIGDALTGIFTDVNGGFEGEDGGAQEG